MARHEKLVTIVAEGRDKGKVFHIRELPCDAGERWANRALIAIANAGGRLPEGTLDGMAGLELTLRNVVLTAMQSLQGLSWREVEPLLDEMKPCITWCPPGFPKIPAQPVFPGEDSQIEEIATWHTLRFEWLQVHLGFSLAAVLSTSGTTPSPSPAS